MEIIMYCLLGILIISLIAYGIVSFSNLEKIDPCDIAKGYNTFCGKNFLEELNNMKRFDSRHELSCSKEYQIEWNVRNIPSDDEYLESMLDSLVEGINSVFSSASFHKLMHGDQDVKIHLERYIIRSKEIDWIENMKMVKGNRLTYRQCDDRIILHFGKALYVVIYIKVNKNM